MLEFLLAPIVNTRVTVVIRLDGATVEVTSLQTFIVLFKLFSVESFLSLAIKISSWFNIYSNINPRGYMFISLVYTNFFSLFFYILKTVTKPLSNANDSFKDTFSPSRLRCLLFIWSKEIDSIYTWKVFVIWDKVSDISFFEVL